MRVAQSQGVGGIRHAPLGGTFKEAHGASVIGSRDIGHLPSFYHTGGSIRVSVLLGGTAVLLRASPSIVTQSQTVGGMGITLLGSGLVETNGLSHIGTNAPTVLIAQTQSAGRLGKSCGGGSGIPFGGGGHIPYHTQAVLIASAQIILGGNVSRLSGLLVVQKSTTGIRLNAQSLLVANAQSEQTPSIPSGGGGAEQGKGAPQIGGNAVSPTVHVAHLIHGGSASPSNGIAIPGESGSRMRQNTLRGRSLCQQATQGQSGIHRRKSRDHGGGVCILHRGFHDSLPVSRLEYPILLGNADASHAASSECSGGQRRPFASPMGTCGQDILQTGTAHLTHGHTGNRPTPTSP